MRGVHPRADATQRLADDDELIAEVIAIVLEDYPARLAERHQALGAGDWSQGRATGREDAVLTVAMPPEPLCLCRAA